MEYYNPNNTEDNKCHDIFVYTIIRALRLPILITRKDNDKFVILLLLKGLLLDEINDDIDYSIIIDGDRFTDVDLNNIVNHSIKYNSILKADRIELKLDDEGISILFKLDQLYNRK